ncbi:MAG: hypothetical protein A3H92_09310 [Rhodospirillales bacterium RIFCSPLOWO2_02_FULL_58_16]|nr:MAG: hypothetical protein A3H92_09310 [Rhodospirillales bacterium RIFCSPLOWO2_02_FULL_58_16]
MAPAPGDPAHAYLDPGTGSILLQMILGGAAGAAVVLKLYWRRIISFFKSAPGKRQKPDD